MKEQTSEACEYLCFLTLNPAQCHTVGKNAKQNVATAGKGGL